MTAPEPAERVKQLKAQVAALTAELKQARGLLNPTSPNETLCGAIRNLQQALLSEQGNAETAEKRLADIEQQAQAAYRIFSAEQTRLRAAGAQLANFAFNVGQHEEGYQLTGAQCSLLRDLQRQWDAALQPPTPSEEPKP